MTALSATTSSSSPGYVQYHSGHRQSRMINGHQHTADVNECSVFSAVFTASVQKSCLSSLPAKTGALLLLPEPVTNTLPHRSGLFYKVVCLSSDILKCRVNKGTSGPPDT